MTIQRLIQPQAFPSHIVNYCNNREPFKLPLHRVWEISSHELYRISILCGAKVHAFILMPNHYHLLLSNTEMDLGQTMMEFGRSMTRSFNRTSGRSGFLYGEPYRASSIRFPIHYSLALKHVYRDPVTEGLCQKVEEYPYSSLQGLIGIVPLPFPMDLPVAERFGVNITPENLDETLSWLNQPPLKEDQEAIRKALRRKVFKLPRDIRTGNASRLEVTI